MVGQLPGALVTNPCLPPFILLPRLPPPSGPVCALQLLVYGRLLALRYPRIRNRGARRRLRLLVYDQLYISSAETRKLVIHQVPHARQLRHSNRIFSTSYH